MNKRKISLFIILLILSMATLSTSCKKKVEPNIKPVEPAVKKVSSGKMPDGTYHVGFSGKNIKKSGEDLYLELEFFDYDKWPIEEFKNLSVGDTIKMHDKTIVVESIIPSYAGTGEHFGYIVNGEIEEGGYYFIADTDNANYRRTEWDDNYMTYSIGKGKFKLSKDIAMEDRTTLITPDVSKKGSIYHYDYIEKAIAQNSYSPNNTYATIKNNEIIYIKQEWVP